MRKRSLSFFRRFITRTVAQIVTSLVCCSLVIATVNNKGQVKGVKKGTCTIKVISLNGVSATVKVTVK